MDKEEDDSGHACLVCSGDLQLPIYTSCLIDKINE